VTSSRWTSADDAGCTSRQLNAHITESRVVLYPWHPWHGRSVWIFDAVAKEVDAVFRCSLEPAETARPLEVPQWMFDPAACCRVHLQTAPAVDYEALLEVKRLLVGVSSTSGEVVLSICQEITFTVLMERVCNSSRHEIRVASG
jgi:hypothetical protein